MAVVEATRWIYPHTAADRLGVDVRTIYRWARDGRLTRRNVGTRKTRISEESIERVLEEQEVKAQGEW